MNRLLVLAPHPDDDILLAGALMYTLRNEYEITVVFLTNGDSLNENGEVRINEAINALHIVGVNEEHVIFLGYGNNWRGGRHIYNLPDNKEAVSYVGRRETYCMPRHPEYCMEKTGMHHKYTRMNMKQDIHSVIMDVMADIIICVDFDSHSDHRALSLLFEEVMGEVLRKSIRYTPVVLKKFAYANMTSGVWDYYFAPFRETQLGYKMELLDNRYETDNPAYRWDERVQLDVDNACRTRLMHQNILYQAGKEYHSQNFAPRIGKVANADMVFWQRRTDSLSYRARVSASSGHANFVNDFKLIDCDDVLSVEQSVDILSNSAWIPDADDDKKVLYFDFDSFVNVSEVVIYENYLIGEDIIEGRLIFDNGNEMAVKNIEHKGSKTVIRFKTQRNVRHMEFQILKWRGTKFGITEFEIYESSDGQVIPLKRYQGSTEDSVSIENEPDVIEERLKYNIVPDYKKDSIYYVYYRFLLEWGMVTQEKLRTWFKSRNIKRIAIYGYGDMGRKLARDVEAAGIEVDCAMDRMAGTMSARFPLIHPDLIQELPCADAIIVTPFQHFEEICKVLGKKHFDNNKIISLKQLVEDAMHR